VWWAAQTLCFNLAHIILHANGFMPPKNTRLVISSETFSMQALILSYSLQDATAIFNEAREQRHQQHLHQKQQKKRKYRRFNPSAQASF